ncbi:MAG: bifunctional riboflavin kinase/FAD synthetase [Eubacterium sp.]|nr:bifunctional riboflavin kinase/FAD synthetase [Eubacterium sp.]
MGTALTIGKFDGFHKGHRLLLQEISDYSAKTGAEAVCYKLEFGGDSILSRDEQEKVTSGYGISRLCRVEFTPEYADVLAEDFVRDIIHEELGAEYVVVGSDFRFGRDRAGDVHLLEELSDKYGFKVKSFDKLVMDGEIVSSTRIRHLLEEGLVDEASKLLGKDYDLTGTVADGKKLGRSLGYPTLNLQFPENKILPRLGVYSSVTVIGDDTYNSITNVGRRPSVDDGDEVNIETFIYDFNDDIYGREVSVKLTHFLRDERKFESLEALKDQIAIDIDEASKYQ